jgi:Holliday junction resolvase
MVTNYSRGYSLENKLKKALERKGYLVLRSSGSHTPIDLVALRPYRGEEVYPFFIQCKKTTKDVDYLSGFGDILKLNMKYAGQAVLVYSLRRTGMFARVITGESETIRRKDERNVTVEDFF